MGRALVLALWTLAWGWLNDEPVPLPGLYISPLSFLPAILIDGSVTPQFQRPGFSSPIIDQSSVLPFKMWTSPEWTNETLYVLVQGESMHVIPLYYKRVPDVFEQKGIAEAFVIER